MQTCTYICIGRSLTQNTKGSQHTHSHVTCFIHLITYLGHLSMSDSASCLPLSLECNLYQRAWISLSTLHFSYSMAMYIWFPVWKAFFSFMGPNKLLLTLYEAFSVLRKELGFLPSSQNALGILLSSHSSWGFVSAHLLVFFSHWTTSSQGHPWSCNQLCPNACLRAESEVVFNKWLLLGFFSHPQRSRIS